MNLWKNGILLILIATLSGCSHDAAEQTAEPTAPAAAITAEGANNSSPSIAPETAPSPTAAPAASTVAPEPPAPRPVVVPAGTVLEVALLDSLSSGENKPGDSFTASLERPVAVDGATIIEKGAKLQGRVVDAESSGRVKGVANMRLILTGLVRDGKVFPIVTKAFYVEAETTKGRDAGIIGGAAGVGAAIGAIAGGKKGAGTGAIIGGAAGTGTVLATKGKEVEFKPESKLKFELDKAAELRPAQKKNT